MFLSIRFPTDRYKKYKIDLGKINFLALTKQKCKEINIDYSDEEISRYKEAETYRKLLTKWADCFLACHTYEDFIETAQKLKRSPVRNYYDMLLSIFADQNTEEALDIVIKSTDDWYTIKDLCFLHYDIETIFDKFNSVYYIKGDRNFLYHRKKMREFISYLQSEDLKLEHLYYFDDNTHFFCHKEILRNTQTEYIAIRCSHYFPTFEEYIKHLNNDLSECNLSNFLSTGYDFSVYKKNENTVLPFSEYSNIEPIIMKQKENCPELYDSYKKLSATPTTSLQLLSQKAMTYGNTKKAYYFETDIYEISRILCKAQRLSSNILTLWDEDLIDYPPRLN